MDPRVKPEEDGAGGEPWSKDSDASGPDRRFENFSADAIVKLMDSRIHWIALQGRHHRSLPDNYLHRSCSTQLCRHRFSRKVATCDIPAQRSPRAPHPAAATFSPLAGRRDMPRPLRSPPRLAWHVPSPRLYGERVRVRGSPRRDPIVRLYAGCSRRCRARRCPHQSDRARGKYRLPVLAIG